MLTADTATTTAERLTRAIVENDADAMAEIYTPGAVVWHSTDQVELSLEQLQGLVRAIAAIASARVDVTGLHVTDTGFVQTQKNSYALSNGGATSFHAALVARLDDDGRIVRLDEYLDSAGLTPLIEALG
jgi:ketosteroid isomerase-like protein